MTTDFCNVCAGVQGPDHKHICESCGRDAGASALVVGDDSTNLAGHAGSSGNKFYCDAHCMHVGECPSCEDASHLVFEARSVKRRFEVAGLNWGVI